MTDDALVEVDEQAVGGFLQGEHKRRHMMFLQEKVSVATSYQLEEDAGYQGPFVASYFTEKEIPAGRMTGENSQGGNSGLFVCVKGG